MSAFANPLDRLVARASRPISVRCLKTFDRRNIARGPGVVFEVLTFHDDVGVIQASATGCPDQALRYWRRHHCDFVNGTSEGKHA